jgi:hypothetical protein
MYLSKLALVCALCLLVMAAGCGKKEDKGSKPTTAPKDGATHKETKVSVPKSVKGKWKAVRIRITDKQNNKDGLVTIDVGSTVQVNGTNLVIKVEAFLPHFIMEGTTLTSNSNEPKNPAVQIHVTENGVDVFKGWLFTLYPNTNAYQHPRYGFALVDFIPNN